MFACQECGRKFKTARAAERASRNGCPKCGGVDIDLDVDLGISEVEELVHPERVADRLLLGERNRY